MEADVPENMRIRRAEVPENLIARISRACLDLPEARQETAWVGVRWKIRNKTFAHVLAVEAGWPPAYARAISSDGPACILTFRSGLATFDDAAFRQRPFFKPVWWQDIAGVFLDDSTNWEDVTSLLKSSYCLLAPRKLAREVMVAPS
jgi:predicted DNA-binding protein (MmcQ/YjbR family)